MNETSRTNIPAPPSRRMLDERLRAAKATNPFKPGDMALHINNQLDARPVESVEGDTICLRIGSIVTEPVPASNYVRLPR